MIRQLLLVNYHHKSIFKKLIIFILIFFLNINFNVKHDILSKNYENNDFVSLFEGVNKLTFTGLPGIISVDNPAVPLVISSEYTNNRTSIAGVKYGNGMIIAFCHDSFFSDINFDYFDNKIFTKNIFNKSSKKKISISISHNEYFNKSNSTKFVDFAKSNGFIIEFIEGSIYDFNLSDTGIFISGSAWVDFKDFEINNILNFVERGGIALILALGWSWVTYHPEREVEELPANVLCSKFNIKWVDGIISETKDNIYNDATIFKIFYPETLNYVSNIKDSLKLIEEVLKNNKDLNKYLSSQQKAREDFIKSIENLYLNIDFLPNKIDVFNKLKEIIEKYPYYFKKDHSFNEKEENILCWIREKFSILFYGYGLPIDENKKIIIANTLNLSGAYLDIWNRFGVLVLDNNKLYYKNLDYIESLLDSLPKEVHNLKLIMIGKLLGNPINNLYLLDPNEKKLIYDLGASFATKTKIGYAIDLWDLPIDGSFENPFPKDVPERIDPYFAGACDHELTHIIDMNLILSNDNLAKERENLLKRAGNNHLNYLRSMFEDGFFIKNPGEFIASIGNQWFCDTWNTLDLAIKRFNNGYKEPINQFLFLAKVLSMKKRSVPFYYRISNGTKLIKIDIDIEKDNNGRIVKIYDKKNFLNYNFILDNDGYVKDIKISKVNPDSYDLLIITSKKIKESNILENYISFKINQGYKIYLIDVENIEKNYSGIDLSEKIRNYLKDFYKKYKIKYLLLIGEPYNSKSQTTKSTGGTIPMRYCYPDPNNHNRIEDTNKDGAVPTDYYYADLTGNWDFDKDGYFGEYNEDRVDFKNELIVGRVPFDDINAIEEILNRSIEFEKKEIDKKTKQILMAGGIYTYGENNCERVDSAIFFENVWNDFLKDRDFERKTLYEKEGLKPSSFNSDLPLNRDNLIKSLSENNFDIVSIFTFGGYIDCISRRIWSKDDGDNIPENNEFSWINLLDKEDEDLIFPSFSKSIYLIQSFWPSTFDYKNVESISKLIFLRSGVSVIGNIRNYWFKCGWQQLNDGGSLSIYYKILENLSNSKTIGESLYDSLYYYSNNFMFKSWDYETWENLYSHASLFGDPTLTLYPKIKISPPSKVEKVSILLTKENYVLINWSPSIQGTYKIKGYSLYKKIENGEFYLLRNFDKDTYEYIDTDIESGKTYYYYIQSFDELNNYSEKSEIVSIYVPIKDTTPPTINIYSPEDLSFLNNNIVTISGKVTDNSKVNKLLINGIEISFSSTGEFNYNLTLNEGENKILIEAYDEYQNKSSLTLTLYLDTKPPQIFISLPKETTQDTLNISGYVKDEGISGIKDNIILINGNKVELSKSLSFSYLINLKEGDNKITFEVEDNAGNKTVNTYTIKLIKKIILTLQIGNRYEYINGNLIEMDVPPRIIEGRTYLPIRYIIEPLGGEIAWDSNERKVTIVFNDILIELWIGRNIAKVNGYYKLIDPDNPKVVPLILNGRTMLPVRFVAESLGCKVDWEPTTKTITITYLGD